MGVTIDVSDLKVARHFWKTALGAEIEVENEDWVLFEPQPGNLSLSLQRVDEVKDKKNRVHPDLRLADYPDGVKRLEALGATTVREVVGVDNRWHIMIDPDDNEFCVIE